MDAYEKAKENSDWGKGFLPQLEPVAERAFTLVEWMLVVGFVKYLQETHGGVVLTVVYMVLQALLSFYITIVAFAITPLALLGQRGPTGRARSWLRLAIYVAAFAAVTAALQYSMSVMVEEITRSEKG